jgi:hypothetical protein
MLETVIDSTVQDRRVAECRIVRVAERNEKEVVATTAEKKKLLVAGCWSGP